MREIKVVSEQFLEEVMEKHKDNDVYRAQLVDKVDIEKVESDDNPNKKENDNQIRLSCLFNQSSLSGSFGTPQGDMEKV